MVTGCRSLRLLRHLLGGERVRRQGGKERQGLREKPALVLQQSRLKRLYCENTSLYALLILNNAESDLSSDPDLRVSNP